jgi:hypothetical protein
MELAAAGSVMDIEMEVVVAFGPVEYKYSLVEVVQVAAGDVVLPPAYQEICRVEAVAAGTVWVELLGSLAYRNSDLQ